MTPITIDGIEGLKEIVGQQIGPSEWREVTQEHDQHVRRRVRRPPVDPRGHRALEGREPVRRPDRPRQPHPVDHRRLPRAAHRGHRLQARRELRLEQGALPGAGAGRLDGPRLLGGASPSTTSAAAGGRRSPSSPSRSRAPRSRCCVAESVPGIASRPRRGLSRAPGFEAPATRVPEAGHAAGRAARGTAPLPVTQPGPGRAARSAPQLSLIEGSPPSRLSRRAYRLAPGEATVGPRAARCCRCSLPRSRSRCAAEDRAGLIRVDRASTARHRRTPPRTGPTTCSRDADDLRRRSVEEPAGEPRRRAGRPWATGSNRRRSTRPRCCPTARAGGVICPGVAPLGAQADYSTVGEGLASSTEVVGALVQLLESDYRTGLRTAVEARQPAARRGGSCASALSTTLAYASHEATLGRLHGLDRGRRARGGSHRRRPALDALLSAATPGSRRSCAQTVRREAPEAHFERGRGRRHQPPGHHRRIRAARHPLLAFPPWQRSVTCARRALRSGNSRSHSMVATKRRFDPNLQKVRIP